MKTLVNKAKLNSLMKKAKRDIHDLTSDKFENDLALIQKLVSRDEYKTRCKELYKELLKNPLAIV